MKALDSYVKVSAGSAHVICKQLRELASIRWERVQASTIVYPTYADSKELEKAIDAMDNTRDTLMALTGIMHAIRSERICLEGAEDKEETNNEEKEQA